MISQQCAVENAVLGRSSFIHQHPDALFMMMWRDNPNIALIYCSLGLFLLIITGYIFPEKYPYSIIAFISIVDKICNIMLGETIELLKLIIHGQYLWLRASYFE